MSDIPAFSSHLAPGNCFICGYPPASHTAATRHRFWSNEAAMASAREWDRTHTVRYSSGATDPAAAYVAEHRPY